MTSLHTNAPRNAFPAQHKVLIGTPTLGIVRIEWHNCLGSVVVPTNFAMSNFTPIGFLVDDAQNLIAQQALAGGYEWLFLLEDDVLVPATLYQDLRRYVKPNPTIPIVSGVYHLRGSREPLVYRGRGNGAFTDFKLPRWVKQRGKPDRLVPGDRFWVDGVPTGALLIHTSILQALADEAEDYTLTPLGGPAVKLKRIFWTPRMAFMDHGTATYQKLIGTSDLWFCDQLISRDILTKAGWPKTQKRQYPFLVDANISCGHIDRISGRIF